MRLDGHTRCFSKGRAGTQFALLIIMQSHNADDALTTISSSDLLRGVFDDAKELTAAHADKIRFEMRHEVNGIKAAIARAVVSLAGTIVAGILLGNAIVLGIFEVTGLPMWSGYIIVGVAVAAIAYAITRRQSTGLDRSRAAMAAAAADVSRIATTVS